MDNGGSTPEVKSSASVCDGTHLKLMCPDFEGSDGIAAAIRTALAFERLGVPTVPVRTPHGDLARRLTLLAADLLTASDVVEVAERISDEAVMLLGSCDAASITFSRRGRHWTVASSSPSALALDSLQHQAGEGPTLEALRSPMCASTTTGWQRWPGLAATIPPELIGSVLACQIVVGSSSGADAPDRAAISCYSDNGVVFDTATTEAALLLAAHASVALAVAGRSQRAAAAEANFQTALASRQRIGEATGMLMERQHISSTEAFGVLRKASQRMNVKVREVAAVVTRHAYEDVATWP